MKGKTKYYTPPNLKISRELLNELKLKITPSNQSELYFNHIKFYKELKYKYLYTEGFITLLEYKNISIHKAIMDNYTLLNKKLKMIHQIKKMKTRSIYEIKLAYSNPYSSQSKSTNIVYNRSRY